MMKGLEVAKVTKTITSILMLIELQEGTGQRKRLKNQIH